MKSTARLHLAALAVCLSTVSWQASAENVPYQLSEAEVAAIQKDLTRDLKDPESARFNDLTAVKTDEGEILVCGEMNAKNGFGGYVGRMPFYGKFGEHGVGLAYIMLGHSDFLDRQTRRSCAKHGMPF